MLIFLKFALLCLLSSDTLAALSSNNIKIKKSVSNNLKVQTTMPVEIPPSSLKRHLSESPPSPTTKFIENANLNKVQSSQRFTRASKRNQRKPLVESLSNDDKDLIDEMEYFEPYPKSNRMVSAAAITDALHRRYLQDFLPDLRLEFNLSHSEITKLGCVNSAKGCKLNRKATCKPLRSQKGRASSKKTKRVEYSILFTPEGERFILSSAVLGAGKFAITKLAQNAETGAWVVVKISPLISTNAAKYAKLDPSKEIDLRTRVFNTENYVLSRLDRLISSFIFNSKGYTITPLIEGIPLDQLQWNAKEKTSESESSRITPPSPPPEAPSTYVMTLERIQTIESNLEVEIGKLENLGIGHRDLHPGNILVNPVTLKVSIIDFGNVERDPEKYKKWAEASRRASNLRLYGAKRARGFEGYPVGDIDVKNIFELD